MGRLCPSQHPAPPGGKELVCDYLSGRGHGGLGSSLMPRGRIHHTAASFPAMVSDPGQQTGCGWEQLPAEKGHEKERDVGHLGGSVN